MSTHLGTPFGRGGSLITRLGHLSKPLATKKLGLLLFPWHLETCTTAAVFGHCGRDISTTGCMCSLNFEALCACMLIGLSTQ